ncbi:MAG: cytochrome c [Deltaproteobacteria bacterium]|nr:cytochrome c [Deltaproteobacteria bacterium]
MTPNKNASEQPEKRNKSLSIWIGVAVLVALIIGVYFYLKPADLFSKPANKESLALGKTVFNKHCVTCHGDEAAGENKAFIKGGIKEDGGYWAPALNGTAHTWHHPDQALFEIIKKGSIASDSPMRAFENRLNDEKIVAVIHYFQSLWPPEVKLRAAQRNMEK